MRPYAYSSRLTRAIEGSRRSLNHYADTHGGMDVYALQRLLDNLSSIDYQLAHLNTQDATDLETDSDASRIAALEQSGLKHAWRTMRSQNDVRVGGVSPRGYVWPSWCLLPV